MRSLFIKIFFLFWLSNAVLSLVAFFAFTWLTDETPESPPESQTIEALATHAVSVYERHGLPALYAYLAQLRKSQHVRGFVLDAQGRALAKPVPEHIATQIERYPQSISPLANRAGRFFIRAVEVQSPSGTPYRFIATYRPRRFWWHRHMPPSGRFALFLVATALASVAIAVLLTRPLRRLRAATQQFAEGNLAVRAPVAVRQRADAIGELGREFDHMAERIEKLVEAQNRLLRDVSHELRSPLARMQVALTLVEEHADATAAEDLGRIQTEIQRLNALIESLLTLIRLESGTSHLVKRDLDLQELLGQVVTDAEYEHHGVGTRVDFKAAGAALVHGDEATLRSAFENVLRNALRYTANNTAVTVTIEPQDATSSTWHIRVCDRGPGVPEEHLERLFEPFFRSDAARSEHTGSHGIGLAIARAVIERHGGQIRARNRPGGGLCVRVELPGVSV
jgi:two-component system sensor histidine kinase CpxA